MANDKHHQLDIERARDLLSPYLDDEVTEEERTLVEGAIAASVELRQELETLRQTVSLVASLPQMPAPRPFTLSEAAVKGAAPAPGRRFIFPIWAKSWATLAATLICVVAVGGFLLFRFGASNFSTSQPAAEIALQSAAQEATEAEVETFAESEAAQEAAQAEPAQEEATAEEAAGQVQALEAAPAEEPAAEEAPPAPLVAEQEAAEADEEISEAPAEESAPAEGETARSAAAQEDATTALAPAATPAPLPTASPPATPTPAAEAAEEQSTIAGAAPPPAETESSGNIGQAELQQKAGPASEGTIAPAATAVQNQATPTFTVPPPSPTAVANLATPSTLPNEAAPPTNSAAREEASQARPLRLLLITGSVLLGGLIIAGFLVWLVARKHKS